MEANHSPCLSCPCLSIGENGAIVAFGDALDEAESSGFVDFLLSCLGVKDVIKTEFLLVAIFLQSDQSRLALHAGRAIHLPLAFIWRPDSNGDFDGLGFFHPGFI
jgi:hypothetical protein